MPTDINELGFGIEIECYLPEGGNMTAAAAAVTARLNEQVYVQGYNHTTPPAGAWKITTDGSLGSYDRGMEVVSSILRGPEGIEKAEKVIRALSDFGCTVSKRCGFHVHIGAKETADNSFPLATMKRLVNIYAAFEPVIDSLMPPSRRGSNNTYCKSMTSISLTAVNAAATSEALNHAMGRQDRFHKLNVFPAWARHKTVEFRQHSGTMEPSKVRYWILTCLRMMAAARNGAEIVTSTPAQAAQAAVNRARVGSKSWQIGQMMLRPEGVTGPEARAAVGWPSVSMPQQAAICGLTYTEQRVGRSVRYFARAAQAEQAAHVATSPTPITLLGFCDLIAADANEREYLLQRQADLGGPISWAA
jgi:hypothetical protein